MSVNAIELKSGNTIRHKGFYYKVVKTEHVKPGKGGAYIQIELKNISNNTKLNERFRSDESVDLIISETKKVNFLYNDEDFIYTMDSDYEQLSLNISLLEKNLLPFLQENIDLEIEIIDGKISKINLPETMICEIIETQPYIKGQTIKSSFKPAILSNGITVQVPDFILNGEKIIVKPATLEYVSKAKN